MSRITAPYNSRAHIRKTNEAKLPAIFKRPEWATKKMRMDDASDSPEKILSKFIGNFDKWFPKIRWMTQDEFDETYVYVHENKSEFPGINALELNYVRQHPSGKKFLSKKYSVERSLAEYSAGIDQSLVNDIFFNLLIKHLKLKVNIPTILEIVIIGDGDEKIVPTEELPDMYVIMHKIEFDKTPSEPLALLDDAHVSIKRMHWYGIFYKSISCDTIGFVDNHAVFLDFSLAVLDYTRYFGEPNKKLLETAIRDIVKRIFGDHENEDVFHDVTLVEDGIAGYDPEEDPSKEESQVIEAVVDGLAIDKYKEIVQEIREEADRNEHFVEDAEGYGLLVDAYRNKIGF